MVGLIMIISLNRYYYTDKKYYGKLMIHGIIVICIVDLIWMICVLPKWTTSYVDNAYWESLKGSSYALNGTPSPSPVILT